MQATTLIESLSQRFLGVYVRSFPLELSTLTWRTFWSCKRHDWICGISRAELVVAVRAYKRLDVSLTSTATHHSSVCRSLFSRNPRSRRTAECSVMDALRRLAGFTALTIANW